MIDPTFRNINRLFVLSFRAGKNGFTRNYSDKYYMLLVEIKDFNSLIDIKTIFWSTPQQIDFTGKLEEDNSETIFFITEKQQKTILNFSFDSLNVTE